MVTDVVFAGLSVDGFDALYKVSALRIAPSGKLFALPIKGIGYPKGQEFRFQEMMRDRIVALPETTRVCLTVAYVDYDDDTTKTFINAFSPFALVRPIRKFEFGLAGHHARETAFREYGKYLIGEALELRNRARRVCEYTNIKNCTPLLLPKRNFNSNHFLEMLDRLFCQLGTETDIAGLVKSEVKKFERHHQRVVPPGTMLKCYSDKKLFFKSPGNARHGYFRHLAAKEHHPSCILAARSRFGGSYAHDLHYDCSTLSGNGVSSNYPNCHGLPTPPKANHINIFPNDFIL